jgi:cytosine/adenosine deaminase-related metal-dependent hydrolase
MKYAFDNANLIDGTQDMRVQPGLCVLTDGETITDIVPAGTAPDGYRRIDLHGRYLLPGLINMHVHLAGNGKIQKKQRDLETLVRRILSNPVSRAVAYRMVCSFARTELLGGVTTIRTVGWTRSTRACATRSAPDAASDRACSRQTRPSPSPAGTWRARSPSRPGPLTRRSHRSMPCTRRAWTLSSS